MKKPNRKPKLNSALVKKVIKKNGWSVASCGRLMGFKSPQALHYIINNQSVEWAYKFADFFEMDEQDFIL